MIVFYFIRHAESQDNLRGVWAGWKDSPLSNHGMRQAEALAASLSHTQFTAIYTSDLKRALYTAKVLHSALSPDASSSRIPLHITSALREQSFGVAEGRKVMKQDKNLSVKAHYAQGLFPILYARSEKFPGGESLEDARQRAEDFIDEVLTALVKEEEHHKDVTRTIGVVSHGIFIGELVAALMKRDGATRVDMKNLRGMKNTAWTKVELHFEPVVMDATQKSESRLSNVDTPVQASPTTSSLRLECIAKIVGINRHSHLSNLHRQKGGIANMTYDPKQQDIRKFLQVGSGRKTVKDKEK